jgi:hypothetical protein
VDKSIWPRTKPWTIERKGCGTSLFDNRISLPQLPGPGIQDLSSQALLFGPEEIPLLPHLTDSVELAGRAADVQGLIPALNKEDEEKKALITAMVNDHTGCADVPKLTTRLSRFPLAMIRKARDHGVTIHILKDKPKEGDIKPTDLGFGHDLDKNGKIEVGKWVDLNGDGKEDPGEREDLTPGGYSWNDVKGAYDTASNILFYKEIEVDNESDYYNASVLHEFSHAIDDALRDDGESDKMWSRGIDDNYEAARKKEPGHGFVDGYAATNKAEYLAQSVAAYLTDRTIPEDPTNDEVTYFAPDNITRAHLKARDPAMYEFLEGRLS